MARSDKEAAVDELAAEFRSSQGAVLTDYRGLSVKDLHELRRALGADASYAVVKNTLTKIAAKDAGVEGFDELLVGPSAIAFIKGDAVQTAKSLRDFARLHPPLVIKGGVLDGRTLTVDEISRMADLESREVLLGRLAGGLLATVQGAASLFNAPLSQVARLVAALQQKVEQDPSTPAAGPTATAPEPDPPIADSASDSDRGAGAHSSAEPDPGTDTMSNPGPGPGPDTSGASDSDTGAPPETSEG
jgi:large subunit ribosomal protein L10